MNWQYLTFFFLAICTALTGEEIVNCRDLLITYDASQLLAELAIVEGKYLPHHPPHDYWTAVPLRNAKASEEPDGFELHNAIARKAQNMIPGQNMPLLDELPYMASIIEDIAQRFDAEVGLVRISKLRGYKRIIPHKDGIKFDLDQGTICRLHVPITTGQDVLFIIDNNHYNLAAGTLYFTNVSKQHSVTNNGQFDRVHLILDVYANAKLREHIIACPELTPVKAFTPKR